MPNNNYVGMLLILYTGNWYLIRVTNSVLIYYNNYGI